MNWLARNANHHNVLSEIYDFPTVPLLDAVVLELIYPHHTPVGSTRHFEERG
jgi:hypothetical protein